MSRVVQARRVLLMILATACSGSIGRAQTPAPAPHHVVAVPLQPFSVLARRVETALEYLGQPLSAADRQALAAALANTNEHAGVAAATAVLDRYALVHVHINPESRVKVTQGTVAPALVQAGTRVFLVKVVNEAGVTAPLRVTSPQSRPVSLPSRGAPEPPQTISARDIKERWADVSLFDKQPMTERLSGLPLEYRIIEIYSRDAGQLGADLSFDVGQGTQDIGFRSDLALVFTAATARYVTLRIEDEKGRPAMARLVVRDAAARLYPAPSKRLAPDLPFQPQVYRGDGESMALPDGEFTLTFSGGPEYLTGRQTVRVGPTGPAEVWLRLQRWIDPAARGWYSGDHHVHAAGCSHYQDPTQGVTPEDMIRQVRGENLNIGSVLTWGPCYYHQKRYFSGQDASVSTAESLVHYDVEISGFPSSHAGHLVLLGLKEQDYPGATRLEEWPTWTLPVLQWARRQGAVTGYAHSGWGLQIRDRQIPSAEVPAFDGIGANEYIVTVTHPDAVDFISTVDTPWPWELNIWYHTLNLGFRTRISGETDFPCIYDDRVGLGRTYTKLDRLSYRGWLDALRAGRSYVSDGLSHLMDFAVNGVAVGTGDGTVAVSAPSVEATVRVTARLDEAADAAMAATPADQKPYWEIERARVAGTREVPVEFLVNGRVVATKRVMADGNPHDLRVTLPVARSGWIAARILPSSHTNPVFVTVDRQPMRPLMASARWALEAVEKCWKQKGRRIRESEHAAAAAAYDHARAVYRKLLGEGIVE
jgi:hypothetical protein